MPMPASKTRARLIQLVSLALGVGLLVLALRPVDFAALGEALRDANYLYLIPLTVLALAAHAIRAWRWGLLLDALPDDRTARLGATFPALMIGYMVNYAAPRLGEVARAVTLARQTRLPLPGVVGTVAAERVLDVLTLAVALVIAFALAAGRGLDALFAPTLEAVDGVVDGLPAFGWVLLGLGVMLGAAMLWLAVRWLRRAAERGGAEGRAGRLLGVIEAFRDGLLALVRVRRRAALIGSTAVIWLLYAVLAYLPLLMFDIPLGFGEAWVLMAVGSAAMVVPTPGGVGSYHYVTIQAMTRLFAVGVAPATAYAVFLHAAQLVLYVASGFVCFLVLSRRPRISA